VQVIFVRDPAVNLVQQAMHIGDATAVVIMNGQKKFGYTSCIEGRNGCWKGVEANHMRLAVADFLIEGGHSQFGRQMRERTWVALKADANARFSVRTEIGNKIRSATHISLFGIFHFKIVVS
jgi:hypothetical protein